MRRAYSLAATLALCAPALQAQEPDTAVVLPPIEVVAARGGLTASRLPLALSVVELPRIQQARPGVSLDEALAAVPGVLINNRYNFSLGNRLAIRGFGARAAFGVRGVRVLQDGIPLTMPDGQANLNNLDLGSAGRIEVIRGPASALHGNAAGGVVSVETEAPPPHRVAGASQVVVGSYGTGDLSNLTRIQSKLGGRASRADWFTTLSALRLDGFREHSRTESTSFNGRARWFPTENTHVTAILNFADVPVAQSPGSLPVDTAQLRPEAAWPANVRTASGEAVRQLQGGLALRHGRPASRLEASAYALTRDVANPLPFAWIGIDRLAGGARVSYRRDFRLAGREAGWVVGTDVETQRDARREHDNDAGEAGAEQRKNQIDRVTAAGPFVQAHLSATPRLTFLAGVRYDLVRFRTDDRLMADGDASGGRTLDAWSPMVGASFAVGHATTLYANVATSFQTPTTTELINAPPAAGQPCCPGGFNRDLEPQRARSVEVGMRSRLAQRLSAELAVYAMHVRDELVPFQVEAAPGREFFRNLGRSRHDGVEAGLQWTPFDRVAVSASYAWSDFTVETDASGTRREGRLPGVPLHSATASLAVLAPRAVRAEIELRHTGEMFTDDANTTVNAASTLVDARLARTAPLPWIRVVPFVGVTNVMDTRYNSSIVVNAFGGRFFEPGPGRAIYLGFSAPFVLAR